MDTEASYDHHRQTKLAPCFPGLSDSQNLGRKTNVPSPHPHSTLDRFRFDHGSPFGCLDGCKSCALRCYALISAFCFKRQLNWAAPLSQNP